MNIPNDIFITFVVLAFAIGGMGLWLGVKRIAGAPFICVFAGIILFSQIAFIEDIQYFGDTEDSIISHYDVSTRSFERSIVNNTALIIAEDVDASNGALIGDTINCMEIMIRKTGSPNISHPVLFGVYDSSGILKKQFGSMNVTNITTSSTFYKHCISDTYTITINDRIGVKHRGSSAGNQIIVNLDALNPFDGTITTHDEFNEATITWTSFTANDLTMKLYLEQEVPINSYPLNDNDTWAFFMLFGLFFVMMGALIQWR